jgi:hypothetical protein
MTRGRDANHAYVVVEENQTARDVLTQAVARDWIDLPAVERRAQLEQRHAGVPVSDDDQLATLAEHIRRAVENRVRQPQRVDPSRSQALER